MIVGVDNVSWVESNTHHQRHEGRAHDKVDVERNERNGTAINEIFQQSSTNYDYLLITRGVDVWQQRSSWATPSWRDQQAPYHFMMTSTNKNDRPISKAQSRLTMMIQYNFVVFCIMMVSYGDWQIIQVAKWLTHLANPLDLLIPPSSLYSFDT